MVPDVAKFCIKCRFNIKEYEEKQQNQPLFCMECGAEIVEGAAFCMECGADVVTERGAFDASLNDDLAIDFSALNDNAIEQLYAQNGLKVENGVLVEYIGKKRSVTIPGTIEEIFDGAFCGNQFISEVEIEEGVKTIGKKAFASCPCLTKISIPASCTKIYEGAFDGTNIKTLILSERNDEITGLFLSDKAKLYLSSKCMRKENGKTIIDISALEKSGKEKHSIAQALLEKGVFEIEDGVLLNAFLMNETDVVIPSSVTNIEKGVFEGCRSLTSIEIPSSVTSIGEYAFWRCTSLTNIEIPNSVTSIGGGAFQNCTSLTSIEIPNSVASIGDNTFVDCASLTSIEIPSGVTSIGECAFYACKSLTSIEIPNSVASIGDNTFADCTSLTSIKIPNSVTSIGDNTFADCTSLTSIEIPNSVTSIGGFAFCNCTSLKAIKLPKNCICDVAWNFACDAEIIYY